MFHNISRRQNNNYSAEIYDNRSDIIVFLLNIFNIKNIIIYIISLFVSMLAIKGKVYPFALSILGASICTQTPIIGVLVTTSIGLINVTTIDVFIKYLITVILFLIFNTIIKPKKSKKDRNEIYKLTYRLMFFNFWVQFFGASSIPFWGKVQFSFIHSTLVYIGYKICISGIATIKSINNKDIFSNIELISAGLLISIVLFMINNIMLFNINISNLLILLLIFYISFKNGFVCGGITGVVIGLFGILYSKCDILYLINLTLTGICGGLFNEYKKIISLTALIISNLIFSLIIQNNLWFFINIPGIVLLYIFSIFIKNNNDIDIDNLISNIPLLEEKFETSLVEHEMPKQETNMINETKADQEVYLANKSLFVEKFYTSFNKKKDSLLFDELSKHKEIIENTYDKIYRGEILDKDSFIKILELNNYYIMSEDKNIKSSINEIIKLINKTYNQLNKKKKS